MTWGFDATWERLPITSSIALVRAALDRGLVGQPAADWISVQPGAWRCAVVPAGSRWPDDTPFQWYGKGEGADGKFQFVSGDGRDYPAGWTVRWSPDTWQNGSPTQWQIQRSDGVAPPWTGPIPPSVVIVPPPVVVPPISPPTPTPDAVTLLLTRLTEISVQLDLLSSALALVRSTQLRGLQVPYIGLAKPPTP